MTRFQAFLEDSKTLLLFAGCFWAGVYTLPTPTCPSGKETLNRSFCATVVYSNISEIVWEGDDKNISKILFLFSMLFGLIFVARRDPEEQTQPETKPEQKPETKPELKQETKLDVV